MDKKEFLCVYDEIDERIDKGVFELTPELTQKLIEDKLQRMRLAVANRTFCSELC